MGCSSHPSCSLRIGYCHLDILVKLCYGSAFLDRVCDGGCGDHDGGGAALRLARCADGAAGRGRVLRPWGDEASCKFLVETGCAADRRDRQRSRARPDQHQSGVRVDRRAAIRHPALWADKSAKRRAQLWRRLCDMTPIRHVRSAPRCRRIPAPVSVGGDERGVDRRPRLRSPSARTGALVRARRPRSRDFLGRPCAFRGDRLSRAPRG